jgi:hypothetical protein
MAAQEVGQRLGRIQLLVDEDVEVIELQLEILDPELELVTSGAPTNA